MGFVRVRKSVLVGATILLMSAGVIYAASVLYNEKLLEKFAELENQYDIPSGILAKVARIESNGDRYAVAKCDKCTASGLFQWTHDSWIGYSARLRGQPYDLSVRFDPMLSAEVTAFELKGISNRLGSLIARASADRTVGIYMGHFLGEGDGAKFLSALASRPDDTAASTMPKAANANRPRFYEGGRALTFREAYNKIAKDLQQPGITGVKGYESREFRDASVEGRILDEESRGNLNKTYDGPIPSSDSERDTPFEFKNIQPANTGQNPNTNPQPGGQCPSRTFCNGYAIVRQDTSCSTSVVQMCDYGCSSDSQCAQQQCPQGSIMQNGQCVRISNQQSTQSSPVSSAFSPGQSASPFLGGSAGGGTGTTGTGGLSGVPNSPASFNAISTLLDPQGTLLPKVATGTPAYDLIVSISGSRPATISDAQQNTTVPDPNVTPTPTGVTQLTPTGVVTLGGGQGIQTFTSTDLSDDVRMFPATQNTGFINSVLENVKSILLRFLAIVTPH